MLTYVEEFREISASKLTAADKRCLVGLFERLRDPKPTEQRARDALKALDLAERSGRDLLRAISAFRMAEQDALRISPMSRLRVAHFHVDALARHGPSNTLIDAQMELGAALYASNNPLEATATFARVCQASAIAPNQEARLLFARGRILLDNGEMAAALSDMQMCQQVAGKNNLRRLETDALIIAAFIELIYCMFARGLDSFWTTFPRPKDVVTARHHHVHARRLLELARAREDSEAVRISIASCELVWWGLSDEADAAAQARATFAEAVGQFQHRRAELELNCGFALRVHGQIDDAIAKLENCRRLIGAGGLRQASARFVLFELSEAYQAIGQVNMALSYRTRLIQACNTRALGIADWFNAPSNSEGMAHERYTSEDLAAMVTSNENVARAAQWIGENLHRPIYARQLAETVGVSQRTLEGCFKATISMTPAQYIRHVRLSRAQRLLQTLPLRVSEIAVRVGYRSLSSFSRDYQQKWKVRPSDDRELAAH